MPNSAQFAQRSAAGVASAVAVFEVTGEVDAVSRRLGVDPPNVGRAVLRTIPRVDTVLAIRPSPGVLLLTPHGGVEACRALATALRTAGAERSQAPPAWPEAAGDVETRLLTALSMARGERAVALLLHQPGRWSSGYPQVPMEVAGQLAGLLSPPLVVATGPANVGKSSLVNALAGRTVARVADRPGVTRDAVAVEVELDGVVVRWLDAPGVDPLGGDDVLAQAQDLARAAIATADLVVWCQDARAPLSGCGDGFSGLRVAMRADLHTGPTPLWADATVSTRTGRGLEGLTRLVRRRLVGDGALSHPGAWAFWRPTP